VNSNVLRNF